MTTFRITGSHGALTVSAVTGAVLAGPQRGEYSDIVRVDLKEWHRAYPGETLAGTSQDILDFGYWTATRWYEPPALDWRELCKKEGVGPHA